MTKLLEGQGLAGSIKIRQTVGKPAKNKKAAGRNPHGLVQLKIKR
jgi:hypothetical protein